MTSIALQYRLLTLAFFVGLALRLMLSLHPHSGYRLPPMHGDFEAQRHWVEITRALPRADWYRNTTDNDLQYWGLDYPPLSAYHSWLIGFCTDLWLQLVHVVVLRKPFSSPYISSSSCPSLFALHASRGAEAQDTRLVMRLSSFLSDVICFMLPVWMLCRVLVQRRVLLLVNDEKKKDLGGKKRSTRALSETTQTALTSAQTQPHLLTLLVLFLALNPLPQLFVDHGHFQFNAVSLGFIAFAIYLVSLSNNASVSSSLLCDASVAMLAAGSIMFKQMSLYYAPAIAIFFLCRCRDAGASAARKGPMPFLLRYAKHFTICVICGLSVFAVCLAPLNVVDVLTRMFPFNRGLYEDKVANFWCAASLVFKLPNFLPDRTHQLRCCTLFTLLGFTPALFALWRKHPPLLKQRETPLLVTFRLLLALAASSLSFFLFSFQVHEKSILLPALPFNIIPVLSVFAAPSIFPVSSSSSTPPLSIIINSPKSKPRLCGWMVHLSVHFNLIALFSMRQLATKDRLSVVWVAFMMVLLLASWHTRQIAVRLQEEEESDETTNTRFTHRLLRKWLWWLSVSAMMLCIAVDTIVVPPVGLPDLFVMSYVVVACGHLLAALVGCTALLWRVC